MIFSKSFSEKLNEGVVVYRQNPSRRNVFFTKTHKNRINYLFLDNNSKTSYFLSLPYVFFSIRYKKSKGGLFYNKPYGLKVCFSTDKNLKNPCYPTLSNIHDSLDVCVESIRKGFDSLESLCNGVVLRYWQTKFNGDIDSCIRAYCSNDKSKSIDAAIWEQRTKMYPDWIPNKEDLLFHSGFESGIKTDFFGKNYNKMDMVSDEEDFEQRKIAYQEYLMSFTR